VISPTPQPWAAKEIEFGQACEHCGHVDSFGTQIVIHGPGPAHQWVAAISPPTGEREPTPTNRANADTILAAVFERETLLATLEEAAEWITIDVLAPRDRERAARVQLKARELLQRARGQQ
jgi:hypothetical protein